MRASRLLSLLWLLKSGRTWSAAQVAAELEVSVRTVLRDVEALSAAGVPVYCERGRAGGLRLLPGFRTDVGALTQTEARALLSAVAAPSVDALGLADELASALRKVTAALPEAHRTQVSLAQRVLVDPDGWHGASPPPLLDVVQQTVLHGHRARLRYRSRDARRAAVRTVDPCGLVNAAGTWYLAARHRSRVRFYQVQRIASVTVLDETAQVPDTFDLAQAWTTARASWHADQTSVVATVEVRSDAVGHLHPTVAPATVPAPSAAGWVRLTLTCHDLRHALAVTVAMGPDLRVVSPAHLRDALVARHRAVLALYATGDVPGPRPG